MNSEKVISNIKKAIKEHLDNNYAYNMLVDFELDVIDWNSLFEYIDKLQQENKILKENAENNDKVVDRVNWENQLLKKQNKQLKEQLKSSEKARLKCLNKIKTLGKFDGENFTRSFTLWSADFNELTKMLDIDKGE